LSDRTNDNPTLDKLRHHIESTHRAIDTLNGLQSRKSNPTTADQHAALCKRLDGLNTIRFDYMTAQRYVKLFSDALQCGRFKGKALGGKERADLELGIAHYERQIGRIDKAVTE